MGGRGSRRAAQQVAEPSGVRLDRNLDVGIEVWNGIQAR
jgi:hypothetical protein